MLGGDAERRNVVIGRFEREAQATAALRSPHTISLYDFGVSDSGDFYYVMELLEGIDADAMIKRFMAMVRGRNSGPASGGTAISRGPPDPPLVVSALNLRPSHQRPPQAAR